MTSLAEQRFYHPTLAGKDETCIDCHQVIKRHSHIWWRSIRLGRAAPDPVHKRCGLKDDGAIVATRQGNQRVTDGKLVPA